MPAAWFGGGSNACPNQAAAAKANRTCIPALESTSILAPNCSASVRTSLSPRGSRIDPVHIRLESDSVVGHHQAGCSIGVLAQFDSDFTFPSVRKRVFQRIRYQFVDDQPSLDSRIQMQRQGVQIGAQVNPIRRHSVGMEQMRRQLSYVLGKINLR